jgi:DNA-directed RNA polymerase specialized sigma24 family protein
MMLPHLPSTLARVRQEVDALPAEERAALMMVCVKKMSYQDAAQTLGISPGMIKNHLLRGRLTLIRNLNLEGRKGHSASQVGSSLSSL